MNKQTLKEQVLSVVISLKGEKTQHEISKLLEYDPGYFNRLIHGKIDLRLSSVDWIAEKLGKRAIIQFVD